MRHWLLLALAFLTWGCGGDEPTPSPSPTTNPSPTPVPTPTPTPLPSVGYNCANPPRFAGLVKSKKPIKGKYVVRFKGELSASSVSASSRLLSAKHSAKEVKLLGRGFAGVLSATAAESLASEPGVEAVFEETTHTILEEPGLDRIDQRSLPLDGVYDPGADGAGVHVAVIDTGVSDVADFEGRRQAECFSATGEGCVDRQGHGTHVGCTVGCKTWGVAKKALVYSVQVLNRFGSGSTSQVIQGIEWTANKKRANPDQQWVGNMSLGGSPDPPLDQAVCDAQAAGVIFAIAAGNDAEDARNSSPARVIQALTVGAINARNDQQASFSNFGPLIDVWSPGVDVRSARPDGGSAVLSGTSMASPHVAGAAALYLFRHPGSTPTQVHDGLVALATPAGTRKILYVRE